MPDMKALNSAINDAVGKMIAVDERESYEPKEHVYYRVTVQAAATATMRHQVFGFTRSIQGHDSTCCTMPDGSPRELKRIDSNGRVIKRAYCLHHESISVLTDEEAMSLVRKGQGSVYKVTEHSQRLK